MPVYSPPAVERAMKLVEIITRAMSGQITWIQAAEIAGITPRSLRRWKARWQREGYDGLFDRRTQRPSPKRAPLHEVEHVLRLYRDTYQGFNVQHFHALATREHGVTLSYSFVKKALQEAGLVKKGARRGRHRLRRPRRACLGELLHLDGSRHRWLALAPDTYQTLLVVQDDATGRLLYAQFWPAESTDAVLTALYEVCADHGLPQALYTDRAGWAFYTPKANGPVDKKRLTEVGQVLARLGVEHIPSYSPQARGRSERANGTLQGRLVNELRVRGIATMETANRYLRDVFLPRHNDEFARAPRDPISAFVTVDAADLCHAFARERRRTVGKDNVVSVDALALQIARQPGRTTCAGLQVLVRRYRSGEYTITWGRRLLGCYDAQGNPLPPPTALDGALASASGLRDRAA
jgi:transposase